VTVKYLLLVFALFVSLAAYAQEQEYRRVDGYLPDAELQKAATEGRGPIADMVDRRVAAIEEKVNERLEARLRDAIPDLGEIRERTRMIDRIGERFEAVEKRWTPLQNLVDRLIGLVWKLMLLVLSLAVLIGFIAIVGLILYRKAMNKINPVAGLLSGDALAEIIKALRNKT
jgi:hypothetical protein